MERNGVTQDAFLMKVEGMTKVFLIIHRINLE